MSKPNRRHGTMEDGSERREEDRGGRPSPSHRSLSPTTQSQRDQSCRPRLHSLIHGPRRFHSRAPLVSTKASFDCPSSLSCRHHEQAIAIGGPWRWREETADDDRPVRQSFLLLFLLLLVLLILVVVVVVVVLDAALLLAQVGGTYVIDSLIIPTMIASSPEMHPAAGRVQHRRARGVAGSDGPMGRHSQRYVRH